MAHNLKPKLAPTLTLIGSIILIVIITCHSLDAKSTQSKPENKPKSTTRQVQSTVADVKRETKAVDKRFLLSDPSSPQKQSAERRQDDDNKKSIGTSQLSPVRPETASSLESWSAHNLAPTFVDQEQGDEMIALASEIAAETARPMTGGNKSFERSDGRRKEQSQNQHRQTDKQRQQPGDEYYIEDDDDEDDVGSGSSNAKLRMTSDYEPNQRTSKSLKDRSKISQSNPDQDEISGLMESYELSSNKSTIANSIKNYAPAEVYPSSSASVRVQQSKQQKQWPSQHGQKMTPTSRKPTVDKLASILAPHDVKGTFSRTDMAIEYLRNILKSKQQQKQNSTTQETSLSDTYVVNNGTHINEEHQLRPYNSKQQSSNFGKQQASDIGKFSISDAKPLVQQPPVESSSFYGSSTGPLEMVSTTRLPQDSTEQLVQDKHPYQIGEQLAGISHGSPFSDFPEFVDDSVRPYEQPQMSSSMVGTRYTPAESNQAYGQQAFLKESTGVEAMHQKVAPNRHDQFDLDHSQSAQALIEQRLAKATKPILEQSYQSQSSDSIKSTTRLQEERKPIVSMIQTAELLQADQPMKTSSDRKYPKINSTADQTTEVESQPREQRQTSDIKQNVAPSGYKQPQQESRPTKTSQAAHNSRTKQAEFEPQVSQTSRKQVQNDKQPQVLTSPTSGKLYREDPRAQAYELQQLQQQLQQQQQQQQQHYQQQQDLRPTQLNHHAVQQKQPSPTLSTPKPPLPQPQVFASQQPHQQQHHYQQNHRAQPQNTPPAPPSSQPPLPVPMLPALKPPKLVGYNLYDGPSDASGEKAEMIPTNFQLGDALYGSHGSVEQVLSMAELEAIQSQFLTAEHPIVPLQQQQQSREPFEMRPQNDRHNRQQQHLQQQQQQDAHLAGSLASLKPDALLPDVLQRLVSHEKQAEESLKELASSEESQLSATLPTRQMPAMQQPQSMNQPMQPVLAPVVAHQLPPRSAPPVASAPAHYLRESRVPIAAVPRELRSESIKLAQGNKYEDINSTKKKSLIVYLNHPRSTDMPRGQMPGDDSIAQSVFDQYSEPFVTAKEFDSHGLSKDGKHLDIANLSGGDSKDGLSPDKDGLSVVVIGDAYKYKKIVLLISSKTGGLKFIPMVKDMKR